MPTLPSTTIKFSDFNTALGLASTATVKMSRMYGFATGVPASATINASVLRGKSSGSAVTVTSPLGSITVAGNTVSRVLSSYFTDGSSTLFYWLISNPNASASISGGNLNVTGNYRNTAYGVSVGASNAYGSSNSGTLSVTETIDPVSSSSFGSTTIGSNTVTYWLASYLSDAAGRALTYNVTGNPKYNANISSGTLSVVGAKRGTSYNVDVTATNAYGGSSTSTLTVTETRDPPNTNALPQILINQQISSVTSGSETYTFLSAGTNGGTTSSYIWNWPTSCAYLDALGTYNTSSPYAYTGSASTSGFPNGAWWQIQCSVAKTITAYSININSGGMTEWYVLGSSNGSTWTSIDHKTAAMGTGIFSYNVTSVSYSYWRFVVVKGNGAGSGAGVQGFYYTLNSATPSPPT